MIAARILERDFFLLEGPALVSFSGGRTSANLLRRILDSGLQPDVHVLFCNTGKEDERTLDFVHECDVRWGAKVRWLEYRRQYLPLYKSAEIAKIAKRVRDYFGFNFEDADGRSEPGFVEVTYETAARTGDAPSKTHPFTNLVCMSGVPNATTRLCTTEMKIRVMKKFMLVQGYDHWTNAVGIRADEPRRVAKMRVQPPERWENAIPLADAGVTLADVLSFWERQSFDLQLVNDPDLGTFEGNCDLCHLKSDAKKVRVVRDRPDSVTWWETIERASGSQFRPRLPYQDVRRLADVRRLHVLDDNEATDLGDCICHD